MDIYLNSQEKQGTEVNALKIHLNCSINYNEHENFFVWSMWVISFIFD